ncbi:CynX/NimT family MFS transporter [Salinibacterium sp. ZJ450]|uniref:MFS transporter n=1 Tax=Salinibacterium sp. ZJ450 TaxID=2708338 RepID=UPI0014245F1F|nr:MFS transporter [Salinibacterium sp. ZJ450]
MTAPRSLPLWSGRTLALLSTLLIALNLRTAVTSVSPIVDQISVDIALNGTALGVLGMLPPAMFAASGLFTPWLARRLGLEATLAVASAVMVLGFTARALSVGYPMFLAASAVTLAATGVGNVLLPAVVKRYFPDRVGLMTSAYVSLLAISTTIPAAISVPIADAAGWRTALMTWAVLGLTALIPWVFMWLEHRKTLAAARRDPSPEVEEGPAEIVGALWRSRTTWALTLAFAVSSLNAYTMFAWLPELLMEQSQLSSVQAGVLLSVYAFIGLPLGLVMPFLTVRSRRPGLLVQLFTAQLLIGYSGLLLAPTLAPWLWVIIMGGPLLFPVTLTLINLHTRDHRVTTAVSGFVQGIGYSMGAVGPLLFGVLRDVSGSWTLPLVFLLLTAAGSLVAGILLSKPRMVDDELRAQ